MPQHVSRAGGGVGRGVKESMKGLLEIDLRERETHLPLGPCGRDPERLLGPCREVGHVPESPRGLGPECGRRRRGGLQRLCGPGATASAPASAPASGGGSGSVLARPEVEEVDCRVGGGHTGY